MWKTKTKNTRRINTKPVRIIIINKYSEYVFYFNISSSYNIWSYILCSNLNIVFPGHFYPLPIWDKLGIALLHAKTPFAARFGTVYSRC